jgi:Ca2+-binding RTX toxin-like protein
MEVLFLLCGLVGLSVLIENRDDTDGSTDESPDEGTDGGTDENPPLPTNLTVTGSEADDSLLGGNGDDQISGLAGDDLISGQAGDDTLYGGAGNDLFAWHEGEDVIFGGTGDDSIFDARVPFYTGPNISVIDGGSGNDSIGFDGGSTITGGTGADVLTLFHNAQEDGASSITDFDPAQDSLSVYLDEVEASAGGELRLEDWDDGQGADLYYGEELLARISGAQGMEPASIDLHVSLATNENGTSFTDGDGNATLFGTVYDDTIFGGGGDDLIIVGDTPSFGGSPTQGGENLAYGGAGNDTLAGTGGTFEVTRGDTDAPVLEYRQEISRDTLFGGDGNDVLLSENGNDLTGGAGEDVFAISHLTGENAEGFTLLPEPTVITDFDPANDEIVVTNDTIPPGSALSIAVWANGLGANILAGTTVIAQVTGGQTLTVADIRLENSLIEA